MVSFKSKVKKFSYLNSAASQLLNSAATQPFLNSATPDSYRDQLFMARDKSKGREKSRPFRLYQVFIA